MTQAAIRVGLRSCGLTTQARFLRATRLWKSDFQPERPTLLVREAFSRHIAAAAYQGTVPQDSSSDIPGSYAGESSPSWDAAGSGQQAPGMQQRPLDQLPNPPRPPICAWHPDHVNSVRVIGEVEGPPAVRYEGRDPPGLHASLLLGVPASRQMAAARALASIHVDFFGEQARQVERYVAKGMHLAVGGSLHQGMLQDDASGELKPMMKIQCDSFQVVDMSKGSLSVHSPKMRLLPTKAGADRRARTASSAVTYDLFQEQGKSVEQVTAERGMRASAVVESLMKHAVAGDPIDWARLAASYQLGPSGSPWMTANEINEVVEEVVEAATQDSPFGTRPDLQTMPLRPVRARLAYHPTAGPKVLSQEQLAPSGDKLGVTYNQLRIVLAMKQLGLDWDSIITQDPPPPPAYPPGSSPTGYDPAAVQQ